MKAEYLVKVILPPFIIFAVLVALTIAKVISGWLMYGLLASWLLILLLPKLPLSGVISAAVSYG